MKFLRASALILALCLVCCACSSTTWDYRSVVYLNTDTERESWYLYALEDEFDGRTIADPQSLIKNAAAIVWGDVISYENRDGRGAVVTLKIRDVLAGEWNGEKTIPLSHMDYIDESGTQYGVPLLEGYRVVVPLSSYSEATNSYPVIVSWNIYVAIDEDAYIPAGSLAPDYRHIAGQDASVKTLDEVRDWMIFCRA